MTQNNLSTEFCKAYIWSLILVYNLLTFVDDWNFTVLSQLTGNAWAGLILKLNLNFSHQFADQAHAEPSFFNTLAVGS